MKETSFLTENQRVLKDIKKFEIFEPFQDEELLNLLSMSKEKKRRLSNATHQIVDEKQQRGCNDRQDGPTGTNHRADIDHDPDLYQGRQYQ